MCTDKKTGKISCKIIKNTEISEKVFEMIIEGDTIVQEARPGQFLNLYCKSEAMLLPRPISICEVNKKENQIRLVYGVVGKGTMAFSKYKIGDIVEVLGPLGNGYKIAEVEKSIIVGGGLGTPPLLELAKNINGEKVIYLGFRTNPYLVEDLKKYGEVFVATEDGSIGYKGTAIDLLNNTQANGQMLYACGPVPMLKALQKWIYDRNISAQFSLEERMGCSFGACVGCVCKIKTKDESGYNYKKVCKDGPVFNAEEVLF